MSLETTRSIAELTSEVRDLLATAQNLAAVERARGALRGVEEYDASNQELAYLLALASARSGAPEVARQAVERLRSSRSAEARFAAEVESLAGRIEKDTFARTGELEALEAAIAAYRRADELHPNVFARINLASLLRLAGEQEQSVLLAARVRVELAGHSADHWDEATLGEAALLLGDIEDARAHYVEARRRAGGRLGDIASMRRQLLMLVCELPEAGSLLQAVPGPRVLAFSGHMIDAPGRVQVRFPPALEGAVRAAIVRTVEAALPVIAYSQAACGSDILFCEEMLARSQEINIVMPFSREDYVATSVLQCGPGWLPRFERVLAQATSVTYATSERYLGDDTLFEHTSNLIQGMTLLRARELAVTAGMLAVSDHGQAGGTGGTLAMLDNWKMLIPEHEVIDLAHLRRKAGLPEGGTSIPGTAAVEAGTTRGGRVIKSLLFADVKGFSRLPEEYSPTFFTAFLGLVPRVLKELGVVPSEISSRGDGLYAVFDLPEDAARFAMQLSEAVGAIDWHGMGLPPDTHVRIALHAGPVFTAIDPVMGHLAHFGTHVTRAARVEPIVLPGQVLVTEPFAAVLAAWPHSCFRCDLVGNEPLAKGYGVARLYRLRHT